MQKFIFLSLAVLLMAGCKRSKDTFTSRLYHRTVSQFNPLFNGEQAMLQGENTLRTQHRDDFSEILPVFKVGDETMASNIKPDMDKAMEKATKVIREHSMMIRNEQKNKYIDDSYLLIGKARFYRREYLQALETFNYIIQQFSDSKIYEEARYWAARTETELGNYLSAKAKFEEIYRSERLPKRLKGDAFAAYAQLEINQRNYSVAGQLLEQAVNQTRDKQKEVRWMFILGQLQAALGNDFEASETFRKVIKKGPPYELLFQAQLNRARSFDVDLQDPQIVFDDLEKMLRDDKNYDNRDQIYYVMAEVAEKLGEDGLVEEYLKKSIRASTINNHQKALSYLKLAEINFEDKQYKISAAYYDSTFSNLENSDPRFEEVQAKKESLGELVKNLEIIEMQDSLQLIAGLSEKQRLEKINSIIAAESEAAERKREEEENSFNNFPPPPGGEAISASNQSSIEGGKWYFYNQNLRSIGVRDFMNKFGNRKLEDNWRRKEKQVFEDFDKIASNESEDPEGVAEGEASTETEATPDKKAEEYLSKIPLTEEAIAGSDQMIVDAYIRVGSIYKDDFKDYFTAEEEMKDLLERYPDMDERGRVLYTLYRINVLAGDSTDVEYYRNLIKSEFPNSEYAALVDGIMTEEQDVNKALDFYKKTYKIFADSIYKRSLSMADSGALAFSNTEQAPRFLLVKAYSLGKLGQKKEMIESLTVTAAEFSSTEQGKEAQHILDQIAANANDGKETAPADSVVTEAVPENISKYKPGENEEHKYVIVVPNQRGLVSNVNIDISDFNQKFFKNLPLKTKAIYLNPEEQMIMVSGLPNQQAAMEYVENIVMQKVLDKNLSNQVIKHFVISNSNFMTFYSTKDFGGYIEYYNKNYLKKN